MKFILFISAIFIATLCNAQSTEGTIIDVKDAGAIIQYSDKTIAELSLAKAITVANWKPRAIARLPKVWRQARRNYRK